MIIILNPSIDEKSTAYQHTLDVIKHLPHVTPKIHLIEGIHEKITEIYLIGDTHHISTESIEALPAVSHVIQISAEYKILGRHYHDSRECGFQYNGVMFSQDTLHVFAGLCAVDTQQNVEKTMKTLSQHGQVCTRMGVYKPRTSPYSFQGLRETCLPYVFEAAGKYGIKVIAIEVTHEHHIHEIHEALEELGNPTGVLLQIGTRNAQNFELLKAVGRQTEYPILFKRGFGITLDESLNAAEYIAEAGNQNIIFCLRGMKAHFSAPHRNMADFSHIPVVKRLTRMPVCIDPSHAIGCLDTAPEGINDIFHATAQGVIAGANMILVDCHPVPSEAWVDSRQAISLDNLSWYLEDIEIAHRAFLDRKNLVQKYTQPKDRT